MNNITIYVWSRTIPAYEPRMRAMTLECHWWLANPDQCTLSLVPTNR